MLKIYNVNGNGDDNVNVNETEINGNEQIVNRKENNENVKRKQNESKENEMKSKDNNNNVSKDWKRNGKKRKCIFFKDNYSIKHFEENLSKKFNFDINIIPKVECTFCLFYPFSLL